MRSQLVNRSGRILLLLCLLIVVCNVVSAGKLRKFEKALWCHKGVFVIKHVYKADSVLNQFEKLGITKLFYSAGSLPYSDWNFLDSLIVECHNHNIELHPYIVPGHKSALITSTAQEHPDWLVKNLQGDTPGNYNLANPEVRKFIVKSSSEFLAHNIDGFHLDYIRFDLHQGFSYDSLTCDTFTKQYGTSPLNLDKDTGDPLWCEWLDWNAGMVTSLVRDLKTMILKSGKQIPLSAAVFPDSRASKYEVGQDWETWVKTGLLDFICPMVYIGNSEVFKKDVVKAVNISKGKAKVIVGTWLGHRYHRDVDPDTMAEHILISRKEGADGISFWSASLFIKEYQDKIQTIIMK